MSAASMSSNPDEAASPMHVETNTNNEGSESDSNSFTSSPPPYLPDQRILCKDKNNDKHYYEAIVRKVKYVSETEWSFFVHYQGWNSRWDRWVGKEDIVMDTPENRAAHLKPKEQKKRKAASETSNNNNTGSNSNSMNGGGRKRRSADSTSKNNLPYQEYCELPFTLKTILVDEYSYLTRKGFDSSRFYDLEPSPRPARSVHALPAQVTVKQVLQQYQRKRGGTNEEKSKQQQVRKFCEGLAQLFDDALPLVLLYAEERPQYQAIKATEKFKDKLPCEIYGCEFLLRLMVRLPILLQAEPKSEMDIMGPMLGDLIVLMQKNRQACFQSKYREPKYAELADWEKKFADAAKHSNESSSTTTTTTTTDLGTNSKSKLKEDA